MGWRNIHFGREGDRVSVNGVELWKQEWRWIGAQTVHLPHPMTGADTYSHMICEAGPTRRPARFAACKLPDGFWSFYVNN